MPRIKKTTPVIDSDNIQTLEPSTSTHAKKTRRASVNTTATMNYDEPKASQILEHAHSNGTIAKSENNAKTVRKYKAKGVLLSLEVAPVYAPVRISYDGILAQNGATELYAHAGIGSNWENVQEVKMTKSHSGTFEATVLAAEENTLNICFRDSGYNWDNNSKNNYVFNVT
ncbi:MAG: Carbohydrate binding domain (family 25) [Firmicutes bacterium]|nr:Carbohydrate binding domain (family 25) [Bacillota bacterium]